MLLQIQATRYPPCHSTPQDWSLFYSSLQTAHSKNWQALTLHSAMSCDGKTAFTQTHGRCPPTAPRPSNAGKQDPDHGPVHLPNFPAQTCHQSSTHYSRTPQPRRCGGWPSGTKHMSNLLSPWITRPHVQHLHQIISRSKSWASRPIQNVGSGRHSPPGVIALGVIALRAS